MKRLCKCTNLTLTKLLKKQQEICESYVTGKNFASCTFKNMKVMLEKKTSQIT